MLLRLKVKLAEMVNGLDLSHCAEGDVIQVSERDGAMLVAEGWAEPAGGEVITCVPKHVERAVAADEQSSGWRKAAPRTAKEQRFHVMRVGSLEGRSDPETIA